VIDLPAILINLLPQIALAACQRDEHHRELKISRGASHISGQDAKSGGIGEERARFVQ
jgi:hypothetical protein